VSAGTQSPGAFGFVTDALKRGSKERAGPVRKTPIRVLVRGNDQRARFPSGSRERLRNRPLQRLTRTPSPGATMTLGNTIRCPHCHTDGIFGFDRTPTGRTYYCPSCARGWRIAAEDEVIATLRASHSALGAGSADTPEEP